MDLPAFDALDSTAPQAFYLGADEEFAALADATITVQGGWKLPVHSHILSLHSRVLKSVVAAVHEGGAVVSAATGCVARVACSPVPQATHPPLVQVKDGVSIKEPFTTFPLQPVGALLRFMYQPEDACAQNFKRVTMHLPS